MEEMMIRIVLIASALCVATAAYAVPASVTKACGPDAHKFCESVIGNAAKRHACMQAHKAELSKACVDASLKSKGG
jgi:hypothetical protein